VSKVGAAARFAANLYRERAWVAYHAYVRRETIAQLLARPGRVNPYPVYERLRADGPLSPTPLGNWATVSHAACDAVLRDRRFGVTGGPPGESDFDLSFLEMDPPDHTRLRKLASPAFSPRAVAGYDARITSTVAGLLDRAAAAGSFDLVRDFASPLPIAVITDLLGIPEDETAGFTTHGMVIGSALDGVKSLRHARQLLAARRELRVLFSRLFELRRTQPRADIVSALVAAEGSQLSADEMVPLCSLLLIAGFETTVNLIGNAVQALLAHPDVWKELCADPETVAPRVVEETLRYDPPVQRTARIALEPVEIQGIPVRRGQLVLTLIGGANRDPSVYPNAAMFLIDRKDPTPHLSFSGGIHYCLGAPLARLEATIALRMLATRMPGLRAAGPVRLRQGATIRGPRSLPLAGD
jgi:cytochrome P450